MRVKEARSSATAVALKEPGLACPRVAPHEVRPSKNRSHHRSHRLQLSTAEAAPSGVRSERPSGTPIGPVRENSDRGPPPRTDRRAPTLRSRFAPSSGGRPGPARRRRAGSVFGGRASEERFRCQARNVLPRMDVGHVPQCCRHLPSQDPKSSAPRHHARHPGSTADRGTRRGEPSALDPRREHSSPLAWPLRGSLRARACRHARAPNHDGGVEVAAGPARGEDSTAGARTPYRCLDRLAAEASARSGNARNTGARRTRTRSTPDRRTARLPVAPPRARDSRSTPRDPHPTDRSPTSPRQPYPATTSRCPRRGARARGTQHRAEVAKTSAPSTSVRPGRVGRPACRPSMTSIQQA